MAEALQHTVPQAGFLHGLGSAAEIQPQRQGLQGRAVAMHFKCRCWCSHCGSSPEGSLAHGAVTCS